MIAKKKKTKKKKEKENFGVNIHADFGYTINNIHTYEIQYISDSTIIIYRK